MKTTGLLASVIALFVLVGCSPSYIIVSDIQKNNIVTVIKINGEDYWTATGFAESYNLKSCYQTAVGRAEKKLVNFLSKPEIHDRMVRFSYKTNHWSVHKQKIERINDSFWRVQIILVAPCNLNPKKS